MYETLINGVKGVIEEKTNKNNNIFVKGWVFSERFGVCPVRCKYEGVIKSVEISTRTDICEIFKRNNIILCGWSVELPQNKYCDIQLKLEGEWQTFLSFNTFNASTNENKKNIVVENTVDESPIHNIDEYIKNAVEQFKKLNPGIELTQPKTKTLNLEIVQNNLSNLYVFDNFYKNPDDIRKILIDTSSLDIIQIDYLKAHIELILNKKIASLDKYKSTIKNNLSVSTDPILINTSEHQYSAVIFLTPDAPINSGITLYRSRHTKNMIVSETDKSTVFKNGNQDITEFEPVDIIGNIYNRLVIFNSHLIHGISHNFGTNIHNGRLVQIVSFDIEK